MEYLESERSVPPVSLEELSAAGYRPDTPLGLEVRGGESSEGEPLVSWAPVMCTSSYELWYSSLDAGETDSGIQHTIFSFLDHFHNCSFPILNF